MSSDKTHFDTTDGIEDVELEDAEVDEASFDELVKQRQETVHEAVQQYRETVGVADEGNESDSLKKSDTEQSDGPVETVAFEHAKTDGDIIKQTGIARLGVDLTDEDDEAMQELVKDARHGDVEVGLRKESSGDPTHDAISKGTQGVRERFERDVPMTELAPSEQASTLAKEASDDVGVDSLIEEAANLPKSPGAVREQVFEKVYSDITKFVRTFYGESAIDRDVLNTVREKIATDAGRRAMVARKADEDGVTRDADGYNPEEGGEDATESEEGADGGDTDAPDTDGDSEDVDLTDDDLTLDE